MMQQIYTRFQPAVERIQQLLRENDSTIIVGIDGNCGSGKSTLAMYLKDIFECNIFHMDDFFLQPHQRTMNRLQEIGGNVDYERFNQEVLKKIRDGEEVTYRPFRCQIQKIEEGVRIPYKRLNIIEGSYCMHPYFNQPYQLKIFLSIDQENQLRIIKKREGEVKLKRFIEEWIPKEQKYFETFEIQNDCLILPWVE